MEPSAILIDTGVSPGDCASKVIGGVDINDGKSTLGDDNGHGTQCANIIAEVCDSKPNIFTIKVLNHNMECSLEKLIKALEFTRKIDIRVVSLSLATIKKESQQTLQKIMRKLNTEGKIMICAAPNHGDIGYPAACDGTIGVDGAIFQKNNDYWYNKNSPVQCIANKTPVLVKSIGDTYKMFGGTSKATAVMTGIVLNKLSKNPDLKYEELEALLETFAKQTYWKTEEVVKAKSFDYELQEDEEHNELYETIRNILSCYFKKKNRTISMEELDGNITDFFYPNDFYEILKEIEYCTGVNIVYSGVDYRVFKSISTLTRFIKGKID